MKLQSPNKELLNDRIFYITCLYQTKFASNQATLFLEVSGCSLNHQFIEIHKLLELQVCTCDKNNRKIEVQEKTFCLLIFF